MESTNSIAPNSSPSSPPSPVINNSSNNTSSSSPSNSRQQQQSNNSSQSQMATATAVANHAQPPSNPTSRDAGVAKRYRSAPAKTFQCRGYGDCHMVFSRSEHLARHIRKHTGERPFSCHCGKQFSRLDNLRQHAQTVHADKQDLNEQMMRELTALHTSMAAQHKSQNGRGKRAQATQQMVPTQQQQGANGAAVGGGVGPSGSNSAMGSHPSVKPEEMHRSLSSNYGQQRPGTSVGYDVGPDQNGSSATFSGTRSWPLPTNNLDLEQSTTQPGTGQGTRSIPSTAAHSAHHSANNHSFRDPGQSFRVPPASSQHQQQSTLQQSTTSAPGQSFLASPASSFNVPVSNIRPTSSSSRPPTSGGNADARTTTLPPLSAVVSQSLSSSGHQPPVLPLPSTASGFGRSRRPATAPGLGSTSPAYYAQRYDYQRGASGLGSISELPVYSTSGRVSHYTEQLAGGPTSATAAYDSSGGREYPPSPPGGASNDSPFSFHPPSISDAPSNPRKRRSGSDASDDDDVSTANTATRPPPTPSGGEYEYGSESRPQSRRLSVMELCNDPSPSDPPTTAGGISSRPFLPLSSSRPATASGRYTASTSSGHASYTSSVDTTTSSIGSNTGGIYASVRSTEQQQQQQKQFQQQQQPSSPLAGGSRHVPDSRASPSSSTFSGGPGSPSHAHVTGSPSSGVPRRPAKNGGRDSPADQVRVVPHSPAQSAASPAGVRV